MDLRNLMQTRAAKIAPVIVDIRYTGMFAITSDAKFGPIVRAGFIEAPVYGPKYNANNATIIPTMTPTITSLSVCQIVR